MTWVLGESARNLVSGTTHALRYTLLLGVALGVLLVAEVNEIDAVLVRASDYQAAGGSVLTIEAPDRIDGAVCEALSDLPGVSAAGALRAEDDTLLSPALPRGPIATYSVTEGLLSVIGADRDAGAGLVLSTEVADTFAMTTGDTFATTSGTTRVRGIYAWPDDGRRAGYAYAALVPIPARDVFDQCWVKAWPMPSEMSSLIRLSLLPGEDEAAKITVSGLNPSLAATFDGKSLFEARATIHAWALACLIGLLLGGAAIYTRRLEFAAGRHVGVSNSATHLQTLLETAAWVAATAVVLTGVTALAIAFTSGRDTPALIAAATHIAVPGLLSVLLGSQIATAAIRERNLFRYFKTR